MVVLLKKTQTIKNQSIFKEIKKANLSRFFNRLN